MSPFKWGDHGVIPGAQRGAVWVCPSCGSEVTSPLEGGCPRCKAGSDAQKARVEAMAEGNSMNSGFQAWVKTLDTSLWPPSAWTMFEEAFLAGAAWKEQQMRAQMDLTKDPPWTSHPSAAAEAQGYTLALLDPLGGGGAADDRTVATIIAALQFYTENTLAYGDMPGQLSAKEARQLIAQLSPQEQEIG